MMLHFKFHQNKNVPICKIFLNRYHTKGNSLNTPPIMSFWWSQTTSIYYLVFYKDTNKYPIQCIIWTIYNN